MFGKEIPLSDITHRLLLVLNSVGKPQIIVENSTQIIRILEEFIPHRLLTY